jgi:hypothetical protein
MKSSESKKSTQWVSVIPEEIPEDITENDQRIFEQITSTELNEAQQACIAEPTHKFYRQQNVLAIHWHPEFIPMPLIERRIETMFPAKRNELIIPTQHNVITAYKNFSGVEMDCYAKGFNQKVQLLLHFSNTQREKTGMLEAMLAHTFKYRSSQLFQYMYTITKPLGDRIQRAAAETGANEALIQFTRIYVKKIATLLDENMHRIPPDMIKNKLLRNFFDQLRADYGDALIDRVQTYIKAVKQVVKAEFPLHYFYRTSEVIEEARGLGACIIIPHPEQFWPILLADYDVDGIEVWNPQSRRYTEFLISVINRKNQTCGNPRRRLLVLMGDDTHMAEKVRDPNLQDPEKSGREIGYQAAWEDFNLRKTLIRAGISREKVLAEYRERLMA